MNNTELANRFRKVANDFERLVDEHAIEVLGMIPKTIEACKRYAELNKQLKQINDKISLQGFPKHCTNVQQYEDETPAFLIPDVPTTCIERIFKRSSYETPCECCNDVINLIKERKTIRRKLGRCKAWINQLGKQL